MSKLRGIDLDNKADETNFHCWVWKTTNSPIFAHWWEKAGPARFTFILQ